MLQRCSGALRGLKLFYMRSCEFPVSKADKMDDTGDLFSGVQKTKLERGLGKIWGPECSKNKMGGGGGSWRKRVGGYAGERQRRQNVGGGLS